MTDISEEATSRSARINEAPLEDFLVHFHDVGTGPAIVFLHGSGPGASAWSNFNRNVEAVVNAGYRAILIDLPGWNKSDPVVVREGPRAVYNAAAIKGVLDHLGIDRAHLVGNSMGGASAIYFTLQYPDRTLKLVSMGGGAGGQSPFVPFPTEGIKLLLGLYRDPSMERLKQMLSIFVFDSSGLTSDLIEARLANIQRRTAHLENFTESMRSNPHSLLVDLSARLHQIKAPTMVVWGRDDRFVPLDAGLRLLTSIAGSEMHIFNGCGHWVQWEKAKRFNSLLLSFLEE